MAEISVIAPRDIWDNVEGKEVLVARKGERITFDQAIKYKVMPIGSPAIGGLETK